MSAIGTALIIVLLAMTTFGQATAYDVDTHRALGERAARSSALLSDVLTTDLAFDHGAATPFANRTPIEWISAGAGFEDLPVWRVLRHFHNPVRPWGTAGLLGAFQSSVYWSQSSTQQLTPNDLATGGGTWSWPVARDAYLRALTEAEPDGREHAFAETFRALGQVSHLIQDATVPAHARNDAHPGINLFGFKLPDPDPYEEWVEVAGRRNDRGFINALTAEPVRPASSVFGPTGDTRARVPIAGLIDTKTFLGVNASLLAGATIGNAEFTNGNFVSKDTLFTDFALPEQTSLALNSPVIEPEGQRFRRYFSRTIGEGQTVTHFVAEGMLYKSLAETRQAPLPRAFTLTKRVHQDYAASLFPRAVGYSTALIDYFFRGRLDGDVVVDPADPSRVRFDGRNVSQEALEAGTLQLYGEDATGTRMKLTAATGADLTVSAAPGQPITSATFQASPNAEKFVAVYTGTLGHEVPAGDPASPGSFPGAVIGKVLGGVRVEEIFEDGMQWKVRTPTDVFLLKDAEGPLTVARYEQVKWGDTDNLMVARSPMNDPAGARLVVYEVPRRDRSVELRPVAGTSDVLVTRVSTAPFPFDLVVATVDFAHTVEYRQRLARADYTTTFNWVPTPPPDDAGYYTSTVSFSPFTFEAVDEQSVPFAERFPVVLDRDHFVTRTFTNPYFWRLTDIAVDATGRPLAVVIVSLGYPEVPAQTVPVFRLNSQTGVPEVSGNRAITAYFPAQVAPLLWALIDVAQGRVAASSADPTIVIRSSEVREDPAGFWVHSTADFSGGPKDRQHEDNGWSETREIDPYGKALGSVTPASLPTVGEQPLALTGWLRDELRQAAVARGVYTLQPTGVSRPTLFVYYCDENNVCSAMQIDQPVGTLTHYPGQLWSAVRTRPTAAGERLAMLAASFVDDPINGWGDLGDVLVWEPGVARARFMGPQLGLGFHELFSAASGGALVSSSVYATGEDATWLFKLDGSDPIPFPGADLWGSYVLLEPSYLYSVDDLKFHRATASLDLTPLPASLVTVTGNPIGDYHAIRLP